MPRTHGRTATVPVPDTAPLSSARPLRAIIEAYADRCFLDTDGVTRDARRMLALLDDWRPNRSDAQAGVRRNRAFDPHLMAVVAADSEIYYAPDSEDTGQLVLLFTLVPPDGQRANGRPRDP